ncbi:SseB family protein [Actinoplanes regularis]|uniref:SseB family protein n=1 Tax=Actinoplanes regularis TaxID=52697 RepID=UPI002553D589|nr:SseB family protein [Actinoplanes regularis]
MSEWEPVTDAEVAMRDALRIDDQESYFRILAGVDLLLPVSADALAGVAPLGWGTWSTGGRTHVLAFTSQEALHSCLSDYTGSSRRVPYPELANTWPNLEWWLAVNPGLPIEGYLPAWFVAQLARGDLRLPTRGPGREVHTTSKIQELGAAALAANRSGDGSGGPTYDNSATAAAAPGDPVSPAAASTAAGAPAGPSGMPGVPGGSLPPQVDSGGAPQPGPRQPSAAQPGPAPSGLPRRDAPQPGQTQPGQPGQTQPVPAAAAQLNPGSGPGIVPGGPQPGPGTLPSGPQFGPGAGPLTAPVPGAQPTGSPLAQPSGPSTRAPSMPTRSATPSGLPMRTPASADPSVQPVASAPAAPVVAPSRPAEQVPAAYQAPSIPRDFPGTPSAPAVSPAAASLPSRVPMGSGTATPGWNSDSMPFGPDNDPRGPLQDLNAPLPVRTPMANTPPIPEHVKPYDPAEAQVDPGWAAIGSGRNPSLTPPAGPPVGPGVGMPAGYGAGLPAGQGMGAPAGPSVSSLPTRGGTDLPRRQPGQAAGPSQTTSFSGFTNARTMPASAPAPSFPQGPASPQAAAAQGGLSAAAPALGAPLAGAPAPGAPAASDGPGNSLPRRQVTPPSERPSSMAAAAQAITGGRTPAPDPSLAQRDVPTAADRFGPSGPPPALPRSDFGRPGGQSAPPAPSGRPGLPPPVIPGVPGAGAAAPGPVSGAGVSGFAAPGSPASAYPASGGPASAYPASGSPASAYPATPGDPASGYGAPTGAPGYGAPSAYVPAAPGHSAPGASGYGAPAAPGPVLGMPPQGSPASAYASQAQTTRMAVSPAPTSGASGLGVAGSSTGGGPGRESRVHDNFVPANDTERELQDAADSGNTDVFLSTLLLANVLVPVAHHSRPGSAPGESGFAFQPEEVEGDKFLIVFTSKDRLSEHHSEPTRTVGVRFYELIRNWPDPNWSFAVNPGTPVGAKYPGAQIIALANWATEAGLGADPIEGPAVEETGATVPAPEPASDEAQHATVMQKTIAADQVDYYLDRGYDRVAGFVHRASEVEHLRTPAELFGALGLNYDGSPFQLDAKEAFVLRWPAFRPSLYRIPYGGQNEQALRAMDGWVIERPPFRGNGFAPGEGRDVVAEFKVDSVRLPHGAQLWRTDVDGNERMLAIFDADGPLWRRVGEQ